MADNVATWKYETVCAVLDLANLSDTQLSRIAIKRHAKSISDSMTKAYECECDGLANHSV